MNTWIRRTALVSAAFAFACTPHPVAGVKELKPEEAAPLVSAGAKPVDANVEGFRKENGILPGAILLSSSSSYKLEELPADKASKLIFYCTNRL